jgi:hypothetical protein
VRIHSPVVIIVPPWKHRSTVRTEHSWKPCYINAVASSVQVHGNSSRDGSRRSLDSPENQCSIGFQPVFCSHVERCSTLLARLNCALLWRSNTYDSRIHRRFRFYRAGTLSRLLKMENGEIKEAVRTVSRLVELNSFGLPSSHARPHYAGQLD